MTEQRHVRLFRNGRNQAVRLLRDVFREIAPIGVRRTAGGKADQIDQ